jgi:hypothetical protein
VGAAVGAAAAAVIALLGFEVVHLNDRVDQLAHPGRSEVAAAAVDALTNPAARRVALRRGDGNVAAQAALLPDGDGFIADFGLPPLPSDRTYQLWALAGDEKISAAVLGPNPPRYAAFHFRGGSISGFAVTVERAGGASQPTNEPTLAGVIRQA